MRGGAVCWPGGVAGRRAAAAGPGRVSIGQNQSSAWPACRSRRRTRRPRPAGRLRRRVPQAARAQIYLDGNSLGLLCRPAEAALAEAVEAWRTRAILGWTEGPEPWFDMSRKGEPAPRAAPGGRSGGRDGRPVHDRQPAPTAGDLLRPGRRRPRILIDEWCLPERTGTRSRATCGSAAGTRRGTWWSCPTATTCWRTRTSWRRWRAASGWRCCHRPSTGADNSWTWPA